MDALTLHRIHFAFTITYHYLFPQLTMGLALLIVVLKTMALRTNDERYNVAARFWARIFSVNFLLGVVTGIPMEFQFGTNWSEFSRRTGGVIGQPLAMEGVFSFFLESAFLGLFLFGEKRLSKLAHWGAAFLVFLGSWISGFFIIVTDAWMQHPVAYRLLPNGTYEVSSFWGLLMNPWAWLQYAHNMSGAVITGAFVMAAVGALYVLQNREGDYGRIFLKLGVQAGLISCIAQIFPTGDLHGKYLARHQPVAIAAMEGLFHSEKGAPMVVMGQPNFATQKIDNPIAVNKVLSFLIYGTTAAEVRGLDQFPPRSMAHHIAPALLRLPHYGGPRNLLRRSDGRCSIPALARQTLHGSLGALAHPAQLPAAVYREYRRLDDCRDRSPAVARIRSAPHVRRLLETHRRQHEPVHAARFPWYVFRSLYPLDRDRLHHDSEGSEPDP